MTGEGVHERVEQVPRTTPSDVVERVRVMMVAQQKACSGAA
jgi:hypothetical protein